MSSWTRLQGIQIPPSSAKRAPSVLDESFFDFVFEWDKATQTPQRTAEAQKPQLPTFSSEAGAQPFERSRKDQTTPQETVSCTDGSLRDLASNTQHAKAVPKTPAGFRFEEDNDDGDKKRPILQIKHPLVPVLWPKVSSTPSRSPQHAPGIKVLESLLSNLYLEEDKPESRVANLAPITQKVPSLGALSLSKPNLSPETPLETSKGTSGLSSNALSRYPTKASLIINQPSFPHSGGHASLYPAYHFMGPSLNTDEQDPYLSLKLDDDWDFQLLFPAPEITSPSSDWPVDQGQVHTAGPPIGIPSTNKSHGRGASFSSSVRSHPYRSLSFGGPGEVIPSPGASFVDYVAKHFAPNQQQAALSIFNYKQAHPDSAIPASFITAELAEVHEGRGWCLLGNCGVDRAKQRLNPHYDVHKDTSRKRLDHLYDHIRDKHFDSRPFRCSFSPCMQTFSREHDLKRHEKTHSSVSRPCDVCGKHYTRDDNLKRHMQLKHWSLPQTNRGSSSASYPF